MKSSDSEVQWGGAIRFDTGSPSYLGWIVAAKLVPNTRLQEILADDPSHPVARAEEQKRRTPYRVMIIELDRTVHEAGDYESNADYRRKEVHFFETSEEAELYLAGYGVLLAHLREPKEVDVP